MKNKARELDYNARNSYSTPSEVASGSLSSCFWKKPSSLPTATQGTSSYFHPLTELSAWRQIETKMEPIGRVKHLRDVQFNSRKSGLC